MLHQQLDVATSRQMQLGQCVCLYCGGIGHTTSLGCPFLDGHQLLYRAMPKAAADQLIGGTAYYNPLGETLTAYQHVSYGNVRVRSRFFSASTELDPAIFWSTRIVRNGYTVPSRGHNWDHIGIAMLLRSHVRVEYDVSNAYQCSIHGMNTEMMVPDANGRCQSDPRPWRLATTNSEVILSRIEPAALLAYHTVQELCLWGLDGPSRNERSVQYDRWCMYDLWGSRSRNGFIVSCPHWLPR